MIDDVVYYTSLLVCISLSTCYRRIDDPVAKRNYGAGLGILVACLVCGCHIYHSVFIVWGNVIIIKCCDRRYVHQMSMLYTWTYLLYLHCNALPLYVMWMHQTMALRLVGLAFEVNSLVKNNNSTVPSSTVRFADDANALTAVPNAVDIIAYSYYFIGLHKGPYYRWIIYYDHLSSSFGDLEDCRIITVHKLMKAAVFFLIYGMLKMKFPAKLLLPIRYAIGTNTVISLVQLNCPKPDRINAC
ncbi:hypothetical protein evm_014000 [Chilo suppressalis]|nr:hypothetical protein evm_014000 [Chilo suppressalis]